MTPVTIWWHCAGKAAQPLLELGSNENPYGASRLAKQAIIAALDGAHVYPDPLGGDLKRALAATHGVAAANIVLGNGSHELLMQFAQVCLRARATKWWPRSMALRCMRWRRRPQVRHCGLHRLCPTITRCRAGMIWTRCLPAITAQTKLVYLANPNNPTGTWYSQAAFAAFLAKVPPTVLVVVDEAYAEFVDALDYASALLLLAKYPNLDCHPHLQQGVCAGGAARGVW